jgi:DNA-binding NarL/FixJ family response regulator
VLLIEGDPEAEARIRQAFAASGNGAFEVESVPTLSEGLQRLHDGIVSGTAISAILTRLTLRDSQGIETFAALIAAAPYIPILVLGEQDKDLLSLESVSRGAQDYLLPDHLDPYLLVRWCEMQSRGRRSRTPFSSKETGLR